MDRMDLEVNQRIQDCFIIKFLLVILSCLILLVINIPFFIKEDSLINRNMRIKNNFYSLYTTPFNTSFDVLSTLYLFDSPDSVITENECYKLYIEPNKFFKPLLHKEYLFFDLANYMNLPTEHIGKIKLILSKYSYWESVTITSTIKFASLSKISSTLNSILFCLSDNLTKFKGVHSLNLINLQVKNSKTLSLLHSIIVNNHSLRSLSFNSCDFSFEKIGNNLKTSKSEKIIRNSKQLITIPKKTQLVHSLFQSLINHENIQNLSLMGNAITDDFSPSIVEIVRNQNNNKKASNWKYTLHKPFNLSDIPLKYNLNSLCYLDLSHNYLSKKFTQEFIPVLENDIFLRKCRP